MERTPDTSPPRPLRALLLDDDPAALRAVRRALESRRFSVISAGDGAAGLDLLLEELLHLDVLVVASALPVRDARALAHLVRRAGGERDLALVVVADEESPEARAGLLALGVDAVVERSAGGAAVAAAALEAVAARPGEAWRGARAEPARPAHPARPEPGAEAARWPSPFGSLAFADA